MKIRFKKLAKDIFNTFRYSEHHGRMARHMNANILSFNILESLIDQDFQKYIPFTDYALTPYTITHILNDLTINSRKNIVEFGSGASTIYIALYLQKHNNGQSFISFDQDADWLDKLKVNHINDISLAKNQNIQIVHAPLLPTKFGRVDEARWYSEEVVNDSINGPVDCVIVDGPTGDVNRFARFPIINFIVNHLSEDGVVFIDDSYREDEVILIRDLVENHSFKKSSTLYHTVLSKSHSKYTQPIGDYLI